MRSILMLAREEVKDLTPCTHGGEVWEVMNGTGLRMEEIIDFSANVNPLGPPPNALESIKSNLEHIPHYPDTNYTRLRKTIANYLGGINKDNVVMGNGSTELIHLFAEVFVERGDIALIPAPTFGEYESVVRKMGGKPKHIKLSHDFHLESGIFFREMKRAKIIFFCNPNNPTSVLTPRRILLEIIEKALGEDVLVFVDEDFIEFVDEEKRFSLVYEVEKYPNLFVLRSFTKIFGLTGLRVGYGIAHDETVGLLLRAKIPWNVNCLAQVAAIAALNDMEYLKRTWELVKSERAFLLRNLKKIKVFKVFPADANFIFIDIRHSSFTAAELKEEMLKYGILIRDCSSFQGLDEYYIRVAVRTRKENERLLDALKEILESHEE